MLKERDVHDVATEIFAKGLGPDRFERLDVETGLDHDGEASFFVTLYFKPGVDPRDVTDLTEAHVALRLRLLDLEEERFPYLRNHYADDEVLVGDDEPDSA